MLRIFFFIICIWTPSLLLAANNASHYQVDVIVFKHLAAQPSEGIDAQASPLRIGHPHAIPLQENNPLTQKSFQRLPKSVSKLNRADYLLRQSNHYEVLFHHSWLQPENNQRTVQLPLMDINGLQMEGFLKINHQQYYVLDSQLYITPTLSEAWLIRQKRRLKENTTYYLDHPQLGMLIHIHQIPEK